MASEKKVKMKVRIPIAQVMAPFYTCTSIAKLVANWASCQVTNSGTSPT